jgi:hypothetical protein
MEHTFSNVWYPAGIMRNMTERLRHESLTRLLAVAAEHQIVGPAALARALNESDQVVTNWGRRGVSKAGALNAQRLFGISHSWILNGTEPKVIAAPEFSALPEPSLDAAIARIARALDELPDAARQQAGSLLQAMSLAPDSKKLQASLSAVLSNRQP